MDQPGFPKPEQTVSVALTTDMEVSKAPATYLGGKGRAELGTATWSCLLSCPWWRQMAAPCEDLQLSLPKILSAAPLNCPQSDIAP